MALVELIATPTTEPQILDELEAFVTTALGKSVVRAKDTPNFIANRVGIAGMLATMKEAETFGLTVRRRRRPHRQEARPRRARGRSAPPTSSASTRWRTSSRRCRTTSAAGRPVLRQLTRRRRCCRSCSTPGALGQKTGAGFYKKVGKDILRFDAAQGRLRRRRRQGRRDRRAHAEEAAGRAAQAAARLEEPAGAVPLGDPARQLPLRRRPPRRRRRERARHRLRDALGLRLRARARSSSGSRPAGRRSRNGSRKTSTPARRSRARRCRRWVFEGPVAENGGVHTPEGS